jgi:hypothetical protein
MTINVPGYMASERVQAWADTYGARNRKRAYESMLDSIPENGPPPMAPTALDHVSDVGDPDEEDGKPPASKKPRTDADEADQQEAMEEEK